MKNLLLTLTAALMLVACGGQSKKTAEKDFATLQVEKYKEYGITGLAIDSLQFVVESNIKVDPKVLEEEHCLNDIRFYGWTDDDWGNNNYIRTIRIFLDAYAAGEIDQAFLKNCEWDVFDKYKEVMGGNFVVVDLELPMLGGLCYHVVPLDNTKLVISAWIYSFVVDNAITGYDLRHFEVRELEEEIIPKEDIEKLRNGEIECSIW